MKSPDRPFGAFRAALLVAVAEALFAPALRAADPAAGWTTSTTVSLQQTFDDNVFLQDVGPLARRSSWVATVLPRLEVGFNRSPGLKFTGQYAPEINRYHSESGEDFVTHRLSYDRSGISGTTNWATSGGLALISGAGQSVIFSAQGGAPAAGGVAVRDRRDALVLKQAFRATFNVVEWLIRPSASVLIQDFRSAQRSIPGYQNHVDRSDAFVGVDVGRKMSDRLTGFIGHRYGRQEQDQLFGTGPAYGNDYHRLLVGVEGAVSPKIKIAGTAGPDLRDFGRQVPVGFADQQTLFFLDVSLVLTASKGDQATISAKRFAQPGFGGRSIYQDGTYALSWRHTFSPKTSATVGVRAYNTDFAPPLVRNDWIYTWSAAIRRTLTDRLALEASYSHDDATSRVHNMPARAFQRSLVMIGVSFRFQ